MIRLYQFAPAWGLSSPSSFCLKVETYLRMVELDFTVEVTNPFKAPKGKLPFIRDGDMTVADSQLIIGYCERTYGCGLDAHLSDEQRALGHAVRRMLEEHLYWAAIFGRWGEPAGWTATESALFGGMPWPARKLAATIARRMVLKELHGQGLGRHDGAEVYAFGCADISALAVLLGERPYLTGPSPATVDATVYAWLAQILYVPIENPLKDATRAHPNLVGYAERLRARYFRHGGGHSAQGIVGGS